MNKRITKELSRTFSIIFEVAFNELHSYITSRLIPIEDVLLELRGNSQHFDMYIEAAVLSNRIPHWAKVNWYLHDKYRSEMTYSIFNGIAISRLESPQYLEIYNKTIERFNSEQ